MQQFTVPQFIDVEDKVIGPLSVRQFIIILVVFGFIGLSYKVFDFTLFLTISVFLLLIGALFAFIKVNGAPFHYFLLNMLQTLLKPKLRLWGKLDQALAEASPPEMPVYQEVAEPRRYSMSHLNSLALIVDTKGYYSEEEAMNLQSKEQSLV